MGGSGSKQPAPWQASDMPSMDGKIVIVTGSNSGIGFVTAMELVRKGAHVVLACRNQIKAEDAIGRIQKQIELDGSATVSSGSVRSRMTFLPLDLSDLQSVRAFVQGFQSKFDHLHVLVNNAGIMKWHFEPNGQGLDQTFVTNYLGHFLLTCLLFETLEKSSTANVPTRIVHISSLHHAKGQLDFAQFNILQVTEQTAASFDGSQQYATTKLFNLLFAFELDRRLREAKKDTQVMSIGCHPGVANTEMVQNTRQSTHSTLVRVLLGLAKWIPISQSAEMGALPLLYAASHDQVVSGGFYGPSGFRHMWGPPAINQPAEVTRNQAMATKLWELSETAGDCKFDIT